MPDTAQRLRDIAGRQCLPYLLALPRFAPYSGQLAFVLVGSVATGLCREGSDIDIAVVCEPEVYDAIARDTPWAAGRPCETEIDGVQLHYYAITVGTIESKLRELDDVALHVYGSAVVLWDPSAATGSSSRGSPSMRSRSVESGSKANWTCCSAVCVVSRTAWRSEMC